MYIDVKNKGERNSAVILTSMSEHKEYKKVIKELKDLRDNDDENQPILKNGSFLLILVISKQEPLRYGTATKLGLIPTEDVSRSSVLTSSFKVNKFVKFKVENNHHYVAHYFSLPKLMGNASCHPLLCTNPMITPKISTLIYHWTGYSITHHLFVWIETVAKIHDPNILHMWRLPCQKSDTVL